MPRCHEPPRAHAPCWVTRVRKVLCASRRTCGFSPVAWKAPGTVQALKSLQREPCVGPLGGSLQLGSPPALPSSQGGGPRTCMCPLGPIRVWRCRSGLLPGVPDSEDGMLDIRPSPFLFPKPAGLGGSDVPGEACVSRFFQTGRDGSGECLAATAVAGPHPSLRIPSLLLFLRGFHTYPSSSQPPSPTLFPFGVCLCDGVCAPRDHGDGAGLGCLGPQLTLAVFFLLRSPTPPHSASQTLQFSRNDSEC